MRILLVAYMESLIGIDMLMKIPTLGLASIAAHADKEICDIKIADLLVGSKDAAGYFQHLLKKYKPDIVGFSIITMQYLEALKLARAAKKFDGNIKVAMGGYHPTLDYEEILRKDEEGNIDFIIRGEAEFSFNELIRALNDGRNFSEVPNLSYRRNGSIINNPGRELLDIDQIKFPDRDAIINRKKYHIFGYPADIIEMSRGCPFNCSFCSSSAMYGRSYRKFRIERILDDIRDIRRRGAKSAFVADHNVTGDPEWYNEVCKAIIDAGLNDMKFAVQASIRGMAQVPGLAETMVKSGVSWVLIGVESASQENMDFLQKGQPEYSDAFRVINELKKHGAIIFGTFIIGNPDDTEETIKASYDHAKNLGLDIVSFLTLTPYPNTPVRDELMKQDLITNLDDYSRYNLWYSNVRTKYLSDEQVFEMVKWCDSRYLADSGSIWRIIKKYPAFTIKLILKELIKHPGLYIKGNFR